MKMNLTFKRNNDYSTLFTLLLVLTIGFTSCSKNNSNPNDNNSENGGGANPSTPVVPIDPEGTVTINMNNYAVDNHNWYDIGIGSTIYIDDANNFSSINDVTFVSVGEVESLGSVNTIPIGGWSQNLAVIPNNGYIARYGNNYARIYVVDYLISTQGGIMGATIKYQSPFQVPINLETSSLCFNAENGTQIVRLSNPTSISITSKPEWCSVFVDFNTITISVDINPFDVRSGVIVLENNMSTERINIMQEGRVMSLPYYQDFSSSFGSYSTYDSDGDESWRIDYNTATMSGYANSTYYTNEDWLISSPVHIMGVSDSKMTFVYIGRYFNNINEDVTIWASTNYEHGNNPTTASWTRIHTTLREGHTWADFYTNEIPLTQFVGQTVTFAVRYLSYNNSAGTIEIQSIKIE